MSVKTFLALLLLLTFSVGCGLLRETEAPSGTIAAPTLAVEATEVAPTTAPAAATEALAAADTPAATAETPPTAAPSPTAEAAGPILFEIDQTQSEVRFILDEELRGEPKTVVGATNQVAGQIAVDFASPAATQLGAIVINARTFATDNEFRNRAINNEILDTGAFEFITFTPTELMGLPASVNPDALITFQVRGDLTIRDITQSVVFDVTLAAGINQLAGSAQAVVNRADYDLNIPQVPNVANVEEEVQLEIDFVALPVGG